MNKKEKDRIVHNVAEEIYENYPFLWEKFGQNGRDRTEEDNYHHLDHLQAAYEMNSSDFFIDYTKWLNNVLTSRNVGTHLIIDNFERLIAQFQNFGLEDENEQRVYVEYLQTAIQHLHTLSSKR
ncbi:hypothetical protein LCM20_14035 [Halobacillus litoralis]|uniref:hypothetical protein n=1 Tax=Halobacillus litoralis TaxID=45668 RepID=UPI001CD552EE|nr:hypothetical protein [Halobacillus litoralis]MCA0971722.1 hypothetical protein [Halobacillus litoralis]